MVIHASYSRGITTLTDTGVATLTSVKLDHIDDPSIKAFAKLNQVLQNVRISGLFTLVLALDEANKKLFLGAANQLLLRKLTKIVLIGDTRLVNRSFLALLPRDKVELSVVRTIEENPILQGTANEQNRSLWIGPVEWAPHYKGHGTFILYNTAAGEWTVRGAAPGVGSFLDCLEVSVSVAGNNSMTAIPGQTNGDPLSFAHAIRFLGGGTSNAAVHATYNAYFNDLSLVPVNGEMPIDYGVHIPLALRFMDICYLQFNGYPAYKTILDSVLKSPYIKPRCELGDKSSDFPINREKLSVCLSALFQHEIGFCDTALDSLLKRADHATPESDVASLCWALCVVWPVMEKFLKKNLAKPTRAVVHLSELFVYCASFMNTGDKAELLVLLSDWVRKGSRTAYTALYKPSKQYDVSMKEDTEIHWTSGNVWVPFGVSRSGNLLCSADGVDERQLTKLSEGRLTINHEGGKRIVEGPEVAFLQVALVAVKTHKNGEEKVEKPKIEKKKKEKRRDVAKRYDQEKDGGNRVRRGRNDA